MKVSDFKECDFKTKYFLYEGVQDILFTIRYNGKCRELWMEFYDKGFSLFIIGVDVSGDEDESFDFKQYVIDNIFEIFTEYVDMLRTLEDCNEV